MDNEREEIEWVNYWFEEARSDRKRILLLGDSVAREIRRVMADMLTIDGYTVDLFAASYCVASDKMLAAIKNFMQEAGCKYEYILFNLGAHHGYYFHCINDRNHQKIYQKYLLQILELLSDYGNKIITIEGTPEAETGHSAMICTEHNKEICLRNMILMHVSEGKYPFVTLYDELKRGNTIYYDWVHFDINIAEYIANRVVTEMFGGKANKKNANYVENARILLSMLEKQEEILIYGQGEKENAIRDFLAANMVKINGMLILDECETEEGQECCTLERVRKTGRKPFVILTVSPYNICHFLKKEHINYVTPTEEIYNYLRNI